MLPFPFSLTTFGFEGWMNGKMSKRRRGSQVRSASNRLRTNPGWINVFPSVSSRLIIASTSARRLSVTVLLVSTFLSCFLIDLSTSSSASKISSCVSLMACPTTIVRFTRSSSRSSSSTWSRIARIRESAISCVSGEG